MNSFYFASANGRWRATGRVHDLSIPLNFDGPQPSHFGAQPATATAMRSGDFVGDTRQGGSCNAFRVDMNPHCNGTHTECVGHLTTERICINEVAPALPVLARVVSVTPKTVGNAQLIDVEQIATLMVDPEGMAVRALIVRTLPNDSRKCTKVYANDMDFPCLSTEAVAQIVACGIEHLLIDTPSIDQYHDQGHLAAHRVFFGLPEFARCPVVSVSDAGRAHATVTEMAYIPDDVSDGIYLLNLQIPPFCLDAAPSRPLLYELDIP